MLVEDDVVGARGREQLHRDAGRPLQRLDLGPGRELVDLRLPALQLQEARVVAGHVRPRDAVQVRLALLPVVAELDVLDLLAVRPVIPLERARADGSREERLLGLATVVLGQDRVVEERDVGDQRGPRELRLDHDRVLVLDGHALDRDVDVAPARLGVARGVDRELDVVGGHLLAGVELDALAEMEGVGELVGREVVAGGQPGLDALSVGSDDVERLVQLLEDPDGLVVEGSFRVHRRRVGDARDDDVPAGRRSRAAARRGARSDAQGGDNRTAREREQRGETGAWGHGANLLAAAAKPRSMADPPGI